MQTVRYGDVLDAADSLSLEDQELLLETLKRRVADKRREALVAAVEEARRDFREGRCEAGSVEDLLRDMLN